MTTKSTKYACLLCAASQVVGYSAEPVKADQERESEETLRPVVVTATRVPVSVEKSATSLSVLDREVITQQQYRSVNDALRDIPSLVVADRGSPGAVSGLFLRGAKTEQTSVLLDGVPLPMNLAGSFNLETISLENIDRVEVVRGPMSGVHGGKTIGGVVNLITADGVGLEKPETEIYAEGGSHNTYREGLSSRGAVGLFDYSLSFQRFDTHGDRINSAYGLTSAAGHFGFQIGQSLYAELNWRVYDAEAGVPGPATGFGANDEDDLLETTSFSITPRITWQTTEFWKQTFTYQYSEFKQEASNFNYLGLNNRVDLTTQYGEYQSDFQIHERISLSLGGVFQAREYTRYDKDLLGIDVDQQETNWALFAEAQWEILEGWKLLGGVRYDDYSAFSEETTWRVGTTYTVPVLGTELHTNYGTAFAPPSPQDVLPALYGNPNLLDPEKSEGWEVGLRQGLFGDKIVFTATYFENQVENLIEYNPLLWQLTQVDEALLRGTELGVEFKLHEKVALLIQYTYLDAENETSQQRLLRRPRHQWHGRLEVKPHEKVRLGLSANYLLDREDGFAGSQSDAEDYLNVKLTAQWQITKNLQWFGRIENLLDEEYEEVRGYPTYGRCFYTGLKLQF